MTKNFWKKSLLTWAMLAAAYKGMKLVAAMRMETDELDADNLYLSPKGQPAGGGKKADQAAPAEAEGAEAGQPAGGEEKADQAALAEENVVSGGSTFYMEEIKPWMDRMLAFFGLMILAPVFAVISIAVFIDDPGPVFFSQKRVGRDKHYFKLHKFRTMRLATPHDVPTHQLEEPDRYITRVGRILRRTSLDELPQIWDIFRGKMSIIGPRPALWNQEDLVAQRDLYGANHVMPGLTGLAQIRGRDELEISVKAAYDGEYTKKLLSGSWQGFFQDVYCFVATIFSVIAHNGVLEGGTGAADRLEDLAGFEDYAFKKTFTVDKTAEKRVLITGAGSYIGEHVADYAKKEYPNIHITTLDMRDEGWKDTDFGGYDAVFHVAGLAHADVGRVTEKVQQEYYRVNTELAVETAKKAKESGVGQFILMSSMIIYGESMPPGTNWVISEDTLPNPANFYGDSKWKADAGVRELADESFATAVLRCPMIYGRGSKGNYPIMSKAARILPVFPDVENMRSMLYIDNLCELVCQIILSGEGGIFFPQNSEYSRTSDLVSRISREAGKRPVILLRFLAPAVRLSAKVPGRIGRLAQKAFGNAVYAQKLSKYEGLPYQVVSLRESIARTEQKPGA